MNFYVVNATSTKPLAVLDCAGYAEAEWRAIKKFGPQVIVIDEELFRLERRIGYVKAVRIARRLLRVARKKHAPCS